MSSEERQKLIRIVASAIHRGAAQELRAAWNQIDELYAKEGGGNSNGVFRRMGYEMSFSEVEKRIAALGFKPPEHDYRIK